MKKISVENMISSKGNKVPNQFTITTEEGIFFQSYTSIIAFKPHKKDEKVQLDKHLWDYSITTSRYRNIFLQETKKETKEKIKSGKYILTNLN